MISINDISFRYPQSDFQLSLSEFSVGAGESIAIVGPNGCGKTTLLQLLAGILVPDSGDVIIDGNELSGLGVEDRQDFRVIHMGLVFQEFELLEYLNVTDNILLPYRISSVLHQVTDARRRACELLDLVGLGSKARSCINRMSQGERQRVAVCRSLITSPKVLIGDEPTANLDPNNRDSVIDILLEYGRREKAPLIVVTHDSEVWKRFDSVHEMRIPLS